MLDLAAVNFEKGGGVVTVIAQDARSGAVLMVAQADREALERTIATGEMHYRSRSRGLWHKGATSGNTQRVVSLSLDCDGDAILARIDPAGPACHTGADSCFGELALAGDALGTLDRTIASRARAVADADSSGVPGADASGSKAAVSTLATPASSYTLRLLNDRNLRLKKLGEEAAELVTACADGNADRAVEEAADLIYHTLVALRATGVGLDELRHTLADRAMR